MNSSRIGLVTISCAACLVVFVSSSSAQVPQPRDTAVSLDAVVVTADRAETPLATTAASVSRLTGVQIARAPLVTLADVLRLVPGFALVDFDGLGYDPQLMVRGFYGGGEAEYVVVLLDGRPINSVQGGTIAWDALPIANIQSIEIVRGGASPLYGDAALGGIINIITGNTGAPTTRVSLSRGTFDRWRGDIALSGVAGARAYSIAGGAETTDGYRAHSARSVWRAAGDVELLSDDRHRLGVSLLAHGRDYQEPGPLPSSLLDQDRAASDVFHRFDHTDDRSVRAGIDYDGRVGSASRITASATGEDRSSNIVRTLVLTPDFADTKARDLHTRRAAATVQVSFEQLAVSTDRLIAGIDAAFATIDSKYFGIATGSNTDYGNADGVRGALDTGGAGNRGAVALFAHYSVEPVARVRVSAGARADWIEDTYDSRLPDDDRITAAHFALSPRAGVNVQYLDGAHAGNAYVTAARSFKAPTLDQLFDQRTIPVPFPPFSATTSNAMLEPQHGVSVEAGVYQNIAFGTQASAQLSASVYEMKMRDELDFDIATFQYVNIGRSRHRGLEAGVRVALAGGHSIFGNYTLQHATTEVGEDAGNFLRAIPRRTVSAGFDIALHDFVQLGSIITHQRDMYLDAANTRSVPPYTRVEVRAAAELRGIQMFIEARNVFDATYATTGFPDPGGTPESYFYPAAGRVLEVGIRLAR